MKYRVLFFSLLVFISFFTDSSFSADSAKEARVQTFSPQGTAKQVRQVRARFSAQMVSFGDPRLSDPFEIDCAEKGRGRWADAKNWVYDFERDLPAGIVCRFKLKPGLRTISGGRMTGDQEFSFSTGGPAIIESYPNEGSENIEEDQAFVLVLDAVATKDSVQEHAWCAIEGINERVGVRIIEGGLSERILKTVRNRRYKDMPKIVLQCRQRFPNDAKVQLIWGKGIRSSSGVETAEEHALHFKTRKPFTATFSCTKENPEANCVPLLPMRLYFSESVPRRYADSIILKGAAGMIFRPSKPQEENEFIQSLSFDGPFPENSSFVLEVPSDIKDEDGRPLENKNNFPMAVKTDTYPPLAKFSARFGIIESQADSALPMTVRNIEPEIRAMMLKSGEPAAKNTPDHIKKKDAESVQGLKGALYRTSEEGVIQWLKRVASAVRETSILKNESAKKEFSIPKPGGSKEFEVVGIPLKEPGFYVVELESDILGASLLGEHKPMYVPSSALVTNLSAHFKWGRESSLVWVTTLDKSRPVKDASVSIRDCNGKVIWTGKTDEMGVAAIKKQLPSDQELPHCSLSINYQESLRSLSGIGGGLFVFAKTAEDMTFVHSSWAEGIEPWRFSLPDASYQGPMIAHTVLDRSLLRAGETVHMKHVVRMHTTSGFAFVKEAELPKSVVVLHTGSDQRYEFPLVWDSSGVAETDWNIPKQARIGNYEVILLKKASEKPETGTAAEGTDRGSEERSYPDGWTSGSFRVEEFRVPLMRGLIQPPRDPLVNSSEAVVDLLVTYLSGGGASLAPVKLRSQVQPRYIHLSDYEEFVFSNGGVKEGITKRSDYEETEGERAEKMRPKVRTLELTLDKSGAARAAIKGLPAVTVPQDLLMELEFRDPSGEVQTVSSKVPVWPSKLLVGIKPDSWSTSKEFLKFQIVALDLSGKPVAERRIKAELFQRKYYSHRKRLIGGFYSYEHVTEIKRVAEICEGKTDSKGLFICEAKSPVSGNVILQATAEDASGNPSVAQQDVWIAAKGEQWFDVSDNDRIDLLPERKRYEPGETAQFQVRMPFRAATALVTVEREGIVDYFIKELSGKNPTIEVPVRGTYAPNVFVSVLVVRGRVDDVQPTAMIDLGRPAYKLGISEIIVGWKANELKVSVSSDKNVYKIREKAQVHISVSRAYGEELPKGGEVAVAAVDEGLLELMPNKSWKLLDGMMGKRGYEVHTSTAQMQVVGKRHYGLKALPQGGGGGKQITRELFDTLLLWKARVPLDEKGEASVEIPLGDSLTSFRIAAVATVGSGLFGEGENSIRTSQDLMILSGIPPLVREGDTFKAGFTIRNSSNKKMNVKVDGIVKAGPEERKLSAIHETLNAGEAREIGWEISVPSGADNMDYEIIAIEENGDASDRLKVKQRVAEAVPVRTFQATLVQVEKTFALDVEKPAGAITGKGGINVSLKPKLSNSLGGVLSYMKQYPYTCMEQKVSRAVSLRDEKLWKDIMAELPSHLDSDGLVKYFPVMSLGSDTLTSYVLSISSEAGWAIPESLRERMEKGLKGFVEGKVNRHSSLQTADLSIRKMAALESLSRRGNLDPQLLGSISLEPGLWPTSAVLDWTNVLLRTKKITDREKMLKEAEQIIRTRLNFQGTTMGFSTEKTDGLWWLMVSGDVNALRTILTFIDDGVWNEDMPRLVRGAMGLQHRGAWDTTTANAWGVLAMERFSKRFESVAVVGVTEASTKDKSFTVDWAKKPDGESFLFPSSEGKETLSVSHRGAGNPWLMMRSLAALPLSGPISSGYKIKKTFTPVVRRLDGKWSKGDVVRVRLDLEAQADMTWVVVSDPVPGGAGILGTGLGRDSEMLTEGEKASGRVWPAFTERSFEAFRSYFEFVPKGKWTVEYTIRLNNEGTFNLPPTRVEALYAPEMLGEIPNAKLVVEP